MAIEVFGVEHLDLTVNDLQLSLPFYANVLEYLGFRRVTRESYIAWPNGHMGIGFRAAPLEEKGVAFNREVLAISVEEEAGSNMLLRDDCLR
jgi:hypothetical protein